VRYARRGIGRETQARSGSQGTGREARAYGAARVARGVGSRSDEPPSGCVRGQEEEGERDVRRCRPTLHRRAHSCHWGGGGDSRGGAGPRCTDGLTLDRKEVAGGGAHPCCSDGHTPAGGSGEERAGGGERRYPSMLHRRTPSSH
jgi:hypothetical protein